MTRGQFIDSVRDLQEPLRRFLLVLCGGDSFTADDIAQDACVKAWLGADGFRGTSKFSTWLFRIAYNCWYDRRYESKGEDIESPAAQQVAGSDSTDEGFRYQALYQAIDGLRPAEKAAVLLFYMEGWSIKEISGIMNVPQGTVKSLLSRGRDNLRIKLK